MTAKPDFREAKDLYASIPTFLRSRIAPHPGRLELRQEAKSDHMKRRLHSIESCGDVVLARCRTWPSSWTRGLVSHQLGRESATLRKTKDVFLRADSCVDSAPLWLAKRRMFRDLAAGKAAQGNRPKKMRKVLMFLSTGCSGVRVMMGVIAKVLSWRIFSSQRFGCDPEPQNRESMTKRLTTTCSLALASPQPSLSKTCSSSRMAA
jgi:hypothetical protein